MGDKPLIRLQREALDYASERYATCIGNRETKLLAAISGYLWAERERGFEMRPVEPQPESPPE